MRDDDANEERGPEAPKETLDELVGETLLVFDHTTRAHKLARALDDARGRFRYDLHAGEDPPIPGEAEEDRKERLLSIQTSVVEAAAAAWGQDPEALADDLHYLFTLTSVTREENGTFTLRATDPGGRTIFGIRFEKLMAILAVRWGPHGSPRYVVGRRP